MAGSLASLRHLSRAAMAGPRGRLAFASSSWASRATLRNSLRSLSTSDSPQQHIVIALGGNALLQRKQEMTLANQRQNVREGLASLSDTLEKNRITLVHGNGPQVGWLALQDDAMYQKTKPAGSLAHHTPLDVLDAETEGLIGYLLEQELSHRLDPQRGMATLLSQILVDPNDAAFQNPTKFIGPVYDSLQQAQESNRGNGGESMVFKPDGQYWRRVVPSPRPVQLLEHQLRAVQLLTVANCLVICAGGGGIPVVRESGHLRGVEAVIDKDRAACMMARSLHAQGLLILTDVSAAAVDYQQATERKIKTASPGALEQLSEQFPDGSMGPKIESAMDFVKATPGGWAAIGSLQEADEIVAGQAGTRVVPGEDDFIEYYDDDVLERAS